MILAIISFIILLALVVLVHEFGHFWVARRFKIKVEEFGFGFSGQEFGFRFPPKLFKFKKGDVVYSINPLPLGGFVKIFNTFRGGFYEYSSGMGVIYHWRRLWGARGSGRNNHWFG